MMDKLDNQRRIKEYNLNKTKFLENHRLIIDSKKVITGSFNFTSAADHRNAENVILIEDTDIASV